MTTGWRRLGGPGVTRGDQLPTRARRGSERGTAFVEFALILPVFMMLVLGLFTGGLAYNQKVTLTQAVREGARYGAALPKSQTNWATTVRNVVVDRAGGDLKASDVCVALVSGGGGGSVYTGSETGPFSARDATAYPDDGCFNDDNSDSGLRVHVAAKRTAKLQALIFTMNLDLKSQATAKHE